MILAATIRKHNGDYTKLRNWFDRLPMAYPSYKIDMVKKGQYVLWTKERGLEILD